MSIDEGPAREARGAGAARKAEGADNANADWLRALQRVSGLSERRTLAAILDDRSAAAPDAPALLGEDGGLGYAVLAALTRRAAGWALARGLGPGERVAVMMANAPALPAVWIGLGRVGVVAVLLDPALAGTALSHALAVAGARHLVADEPARVAAAAAALGMAVWTPDDLAAGETLPAGHPLPRLGDPALLLFTSGTTGLPKAAVVSHGRVARWAEWFAGLADIRPDDRLYDCLPMHHSVGGVVAVGAMLAAGGAVIVRRRFSASRFWDDIATSGATIAQYVGELPRFLLAAPEGPRERDHRLRLAMGNGLAEAVWRPFIERFAVPHVLEFYAATEGTFSLFNVEGEPGSLGRIPGFMAHRSPVALVRHDPDAEAPARGADGFCLRCGVDEPGEAIGRLQSGTEPEARFEGYTDAAASEAKVLRDVFAKGDAWFRTGDLLRRDARGFYRFVDRVGDTFRWRGENVSTAQVAGVVAAAPGVAEAAVVGVAVPGCEGRAGLAAVVAGEGFDVAALHARLAAELPAHARPLFLRLVPTIATTGTFRPRKAELRALGYGGEGVLIDDGGGYVPLGEERRAAIDAGRAGL